ncbi:hypothetical protein JQ554_28090 [Bradyrhizobium diazoefficiens]|nr:hypothetical protein [Bradyrhizobium diazoefficiens]MBR0967090.1 hypothetical protein [Bradyrhizobium diazoefficiens]MBR0979094.1 hypothetical protein [Bradyrhizobium diazoefficiens]MBR1010153.1 hypothetical protein [Bradyrhizobium diazoefficiens]MBR1017381.1 hypothetical protein [Bradyrhizobium diazoefficiens]MBR1054851.1 hypothetical protein [Bradyrhizobium diazoefficiens]
MKAEDLEEREVQSLLDSLRQKGQTIPTYYLNRIRKGSLEAGFYVALGLLKKLALDLIGKVIDDVARQNKLYKRLLNYIGDGRPKSFAELLKAELGGFVVGRFAVEDITITESKSSIIVNVELVTPSEFQDHLPEEYDEARVIALLEKRIRETSEHDT